MKWLARARGVRSLVGKDYVYVWADGLYLKVREAEHVRQMRRLTGSAG